MRQQPVAAGFGAEPRKTNAEGGMGFRDICLSAWAKATEDDGDKGRSGGWSSGKASIFLRAKAASAASGGREGQPGGIAGRSGRVRGGAPVNKDTRAAEDAECHS